MADLVRLAHRLNVIERRRWELLALLRTTTLETKYTDILKWKRELVRLTDQHIRLSRRLT